MDRESFFKGQLEAVHKALTKQEIPLKPKHARSLILGTHHEKSCTIFWNNVGRIQLEKNPILTWKFCHLLHKLIRDGHKNVPAESHRHVRRIRVLGDFWKHLQTSGYGPGNEQYCKMLCERLEFHRKYPQIAGNLVVGESVLRAIQNDLDGSFEASIDMLDQMESLLLLQRKVFDSLEMLSWSSLVPQGQTLLAPLILVIMDTSKLYDLLVKLVFHLHSQCPADALAGHRDRFLVIFRMTKTFYEEASKLQYFKYLVSVPTLPSASPNFLQASDLECYQAPQAREIGSDSDDGRSVDGTLLDLDESAAARSQLQQLQHSPASLPDQRDEQITSLSRQLEDEKFAKERLIAEARSRIEQYENRLVQMQNEIDHVKREAEDSRDEALRATAALSTRDLSDSERADARLVEAENRTRAADEKFVKLKNVYDRFRGEHLAALQKLGDLQRRLEGVDKERMDREEEGRGVQRRLEEAERQRSEYRDKLDASASGEDELRSQLARADAAAEEMRRELESIRGVAERGTASEREERRATLAMLERAAEELLNASSVQYPANLAVAGLAWAQEVMGQEAASGSPRKEGSSPSHSAGSSSSLALSGHALSVVVVACAAAAYTASIQHYDEVNEECRSLLTRARASIESMPPPEAAERSGGPAPSPAFPSLQRLHDLMMALPLHSDVDKEVVGSELEEEMRRMDAAIRQAVEKIEEIQRKARESNDGLRLEVNERILGTCQALMAAIAILVARSRELQAEIVAAGRGQGPPQEFYKRNHQWTEGLLSAAKAVGVAARVLVAAADGVVTGGGKFEQLIVAAQEIAASTAQLFVSSRVKADRDSEKMAALSVASRSVNQATAQVVASVKSGQSTLNEQDALDFSHLTLHDAKKEEMESQVRCLELESSLTRERARLAQLRKQHYHMASLVAEAHNAAGGGGGAKEADTSFEIIG